MTYGRITRVRPQPERGPLQTYRCKINPCAIAGEVGGRVYVYFHDRVHPLAPPLICLAVRQVLLGLLDVVRLEVPEEGEGIAEDGVVADAGLPERLDHLRPDLLVAAHVLFFVPRPDLQNPRMLGHPALLIFAPRAS